jgi:hypothetical protein
MAERYEADEAIIRVEAPRWRRDLVSPPKEAARTEESGPDDEPAGGTTVLVELTADGAHIHLT